jgi:hypothetical protein
LPCTLRAAHRLGWRAFQLIFLSPGCCASPPTMTPPPRSLQGHPHHDHGEQKADDTSGRESPDLNPRLGEEATPPRLNGQTTERQAPSFLAVECTKASDSAGGTTSAPHHDAPEAGNPRVCGLSSHMCGLDEGANPPVRLRCGAPVFLTQSNVIMRWASSYNR